MRRLMNFLMLSCARASELIEKKSEFGLTIIESIQLNLHISLCSACTTYKKQSKSLDESLKKFISNKQDFNSSSPIRASDEFKEKTIRELGKN